MEEDRLIQEEVQGVAHGGMTKESCRRGHLAVGEAHLGCRLVVPLEGREAIREALEEDPEAHLEDQDDPPVHWAVVVAKIE